MTSEYSSECESTDKKGEADHGSGSLASSKKDPRTVEAGVAWT